MYVIDKYPDGIFAWVDLSSPDIAGAKQFYSRTVRLGDARSTAARRRLLHQRLHRRPHGGGSGIRWTRP